MEDKLVSEARIVELTCREPERSLEFYRCLGIEFRPDQRGRDTVHVADLAGTILELHHGQSGPSFEAMAYEVLVPDVPAVTRLLRSRFPKALSPDGYSTDPDGRSIRILPSRADSPSV